MQFILRDLLCLIRELIRILRHWFQAIHILTVSLQVQVHILLNVRGVNRSQWVGYQGTFFRNLLLEVHLRSFVTLYF